MWPTPIIFIDVEEDTDELMNHNDFQVSNSDLQNELICEENNDLNVNDHFIGRAGNPAMDEYPIGNWVYGNRSYNIELEIYTLKLLNKIFYFHIVKIKLVSQTVAFYTLHFLIHLYLEI